MADMIWENSGELSYEDGDARFEAAIAKLKMGVNVPKLTSMERQILEFCHGRDMRKFLKEEFEKHPIRIDEDGNLIGGNPFDKERKDRMEKPYIYDV